MDSKPALLAHSEKSWLHYRDNAIKLSPFVKELIIFATLLLHRKSKIVFFYPNQSNDAIVPIAIQMGYELAGEKQNKILIFSGACSTALRECYMGCTVNGAYFPNHFFGMGIVRRDGDIRPERVSFGKGSKFYYNIEDRILFSSSFNTKPADAANIKSVIALAPNSRNFYRLEELNEWIESKGIPSFVVFDNVASAKKIQAYKRMGFFIYGWSKDEIRSQLPAKFKNSPLSNIEPLNLFSQKLSFSKARVASEKCDKIFNKIFSNLSSAKKSGFLKSDQVLYEARTLMRELQAIPTKLTNFSNAQKSVMPYMPTILFRIETFCSLLDSLSQGDGLGSLKEISGELRDIMAYLMQESPKFTIVRKETERLFSEKGAKKLICRNLTEKEALLKEFAQLRQPIYESDFEAYGTSIATMKELSEIPQSPCTSAALTTYPFLDKTWLLSTAFSANCVVCLYSSEESTFKYFEDLYGEVEKKYFNPSMRSAIRSFYQDEKLFEMPQLDFVQREIFEIEQKEAAKAKRASDILGLLTEVEDFFAGAAPAKGSLGPGEADGISEFASNCIEFQFTDGNKLIVKEGRILQLLSENDEISYLRALDVKIGQTLVLINRDAQSDLNDLIFEKAEEFPMIALIQKYSSSWRETLIAGMKKENDNDYTLLEKLKQLGCKRESEQTIHAWRDGLVMGPQDYEDIKRIADAYLDKGLKENAENVIISIKRLKTLRREIIARVRNAMLEEKSEELEKLGIRVEEIENAIEFFRIKDKIKRDSVSREYLGKIVKNYGI